MGGGRLCLLGRDGARVKQLFGDEIEQRGSFTLRDAEFARIADYGFASGRSTHVDRVQTIRDTHRRHGVLIDPHTADGVRVAEAHVEPGVPMIVLETAQPTKFAETIVEALGLLPPRPAALIGIEQLPKRCKVMPADVARIKAYIADNCP